MNCKTGEYHCRREPCFSHSKGKKPEKPKPTKPTKKEPKDDLPASDDGGVIQL